jgi:hypothetical protein
VVKGTIPFNIYFVVFKGTLCVLSHWCAMDPCGHGQKLTLSFSKTCMNGSNFVCDALFQPSEHVKFVYIHFVFHERK